MIRWAASCLGIAQALLGASNASAQSADSARVGVIASPMVAAVTVAPMRVDTPSRVGRALDRMPLWAAPIASAAVPGLGQARLGKDRFVAYMATEAYLLLKYLKDDRDGNSSANEFKAIARDIARRNFVTTPGAVPPDSIWKYYESMEKYLESGFFSVATTGATVPETDTATFNGAQWLFARRQYGIPLDDPGASADPNYANAVALYESRAVGQAYRWSWLNARLEHDIYRQTIARSNDAYRHAQYDVIALIANHLLSSVDAFVSVRLIQTSDGGTRIIGTVPWP